MIRDGETLYRFAQPNDSNLQSADSASGAAR
jgi:hypothetical protein